MPWVRGSTEGQQEPRRVGEMLKLALEKKERLRSAKNREGETDQNPETQGFAVLSKVEKGKKEKSISGTGCPRRQWTKRCERGRTITRGNPQNKNRWKGREKRKNRPGRQGKTGGKSANK